MYSNGQLTKHKCSPDTIIGNLVAATSGDSRNEYNSRDILNNAAFSTFVITSFCMTTKKNKIETLCSIFSILLEKVDQVINK